MRLYSEVSPSAFHGAYSQESAHGLSLVLRLGRASAVARDDAPGSAPREGGRGTLPLPASSRRPLQPANGRGLLCVAPAPHGDVSVA